MQKLEITQQTLISASTLINSFGFINVTGVCGAILGMFTSWITFHAAVIYYFSPQPTTRAVIKSSLIFSYFFYSAGNKCTISIRNKCSAAIVEIKKLHVLASRNQRKF